MNYRELLFWLGADAEAVLLEYLAECNVPVRADLTDPQADE